MERVELAALLTCPSCGVSERETMPQDACQWFYECKHCRKLLRPKPGDCCVFCADQPCPPVQRTRSGSCCDRGV